MIFSKEMLLSAGLLPLSAAGSGRGDSFNMASSLFTASAASICALAAYISRSIIKASWGAKKM